MEKPKRMRRVATILCGSACCVYGLTFTSHFYGARRSVGYVPFNSETLVTGRLVEDIREAVHASAPPEDRDAQTLAEALAILAPPFRVLDGALSGTSYLLGNDFTVADLNVAAVTSRAIDMDLATTPRLADWLRRCHDRPAARAALKLRMDADAATPADATRMIARINPR